jgi:hypothetical protein
LPLRPRRGLPARISLPARRGPAASRDQPWLAPGGRRVPPPRPAPGAGTAARLRRAPRPRGRAARARAAPDTLTLAAHRAQPAAAFVTRLTVTSVFAYLVALPLTHSWRPVLAPLTALLVVQVSTSQTVRSAVQRVVSVVVGVLMAVALSAVAGFTWWSLGIAIAACLAVGHVLRLGDHTLEVPISGMLILSVGTASLAAATGRITETLIGAGAGLLGGLVLTPLRMQPAGEALSGLSHGLAALLERMARDLSAGLITRTAGDLPARARALGTEIQRVEQSLAEMEEGMRLSPRRRALAPARRALREGLETLELAAVATRGIAHAIADGSAQEPASPLHDATTRACLAALLRQLAAAIRAYSRLVRAGLATAGAQGGRELLTGELARRLARARDLQERLTVLMRPQPPAGLPGWPLRGELLSHLARLRHELQIPTHPEGGRLRRHAAGRGTGLGAGRSRQRPPRHSYPHRR